MSGCLQQNVRVVERYIHCRADSKTESVKCSVFVYCMFSVMHDPVMQILLLTVVYLGCC